MQQALSLAEKAAELGEVPVGAVVIQDGNIVGGGFNSPISRHDPTAHAEVLALREAAENLGNYRLPGCELIVTLEPCSMCAGALVHARIETLVFGAREPRSGAVISALAVLNNPALNHRVAVVEGVLEDRCAQLMRSFFKERRN